MSFGFSVGDFLTVIELARKIRKDFADAPKEFRGALDVVRSLSIVLQDTEIAASERDLNPKDETNLQVIIDGCQQLLSELQRTLAKYAELESPQSGMRGKMKRIWKRLTVEPEDIRNLRSRVNDNIVLLNAFTLQQIKDDTTKLVVDQKTRGKQAILDWLTPIDYYPQQNECVRQRQPGTGQWLLDSAEFRDWVKAENETLFCPGIPGAGKTILTSIVVEELSKRFDGDGNIAIAYIYCNFKRQHEQSCENILASLLKHLAQRRPQLPQVIEALYERCETDKARPSLDDFSVALHSVAAEYSRVFIFIDALDECQVENGVVAKLLPQISTLQSKGRVSFFTTSRLIPDIMERFEGDLRLEIRADEQDVQRYVEGQMPEMPRFVRRDFELQQEISSEIVKAVDGMFLLAKLNLQSLKGKRAPTAVRDALRKLPTGSEAYDRAYSGTMERIEGQLLDQAELAREALSWIICSKRPLTILELRYALAIKLDSSALDEGNMPDIEDIVSVCAGLAVADEESGVIRLVHYTTQEYFERTKDTLFPMAEFDIAGSCGAYLSYSEFEDGHCFTDTLLEDRLRLNPLYDYAARYWGQHAGQNSNLHPEVLRFLRDKTKVEAAAQAIQAYPWIHFNNYSQMVPRQTTGLHLAAYLGVTPAVAALLQTASLNPIDTDGRTPLSYAAENGHSAVVPLLLDAGADIELKDLRDQSPLSYAAKRGPSIVVKQLLDAGADTESTDTTKRTPLYIAASKAHIAVIKYLLDAGADIESKDDHDQTPLSHAAEEGHVAVCKELIDAGADIESKDRMSWTPLIYAAADENTSIVQELLEAGADVNSGDEADRTPLSYVAEWGYLAIVRQLIKAGANVDSRDEDGRTPLWYAVHGEYVEDEEQEAAIIDLLKAGADIESKDNANRTPLSLAAERGSSCTVKQLIEAGANVESKDKDDCTPLWYIIHKNFEDENDEAGIKLLLEAGADVESKDKENRTTLSYAAEMRTSTTVNQLLQAGAKVESKDKAGRTPLWYAIYGNHLDSKQREAIVKDAFEAGNDHDTKNDDTESEDDDSNSRSNASKKNRKDVIQLLKSAGAELPTYLPQSYDSTDS